MVVEHKQRMAKKDLFRSFAFPTKETKKIWTFFCNERNRQCTCHTRDTDILHFLHAKKAKRKRREKLKKKKKSFSVPPARVWGTLRSATCGRRVICEFIFVFVAISVHDKVVDPNCVHVNAPTHLAKARFAVLLCTCTWIVGFVSVFLLLFSFFHCMPCVAVDVVVAVAVSARCAMCNSNKRIMYTLTTRYTVDFCKISLLLSCHFNWLLENH